MFDWIENKNCVLFLPEPNIFLCSKAEGDAGIRCSLEEAPAIFKLFNDSGLYDDCSTVSCGRTLLTAVYWSWQNKKKWNTKRERKINIKMTHNTNSLTHTNTTYSKHKTNNFLCFNLIYTWCLSFCETKRAYETASFAQWRSICYSIFIFSFW